MKSIETCSYVVWKVEMAQLHEKKVKCIVQNSMVWAEARCVDDWLIIVGWPATASEELRHRLSHRHLHGKADVVRAGPCHTEGLFCSLGLRLLS